MTDGSTDETRAPWAFPAAVLLATVLGAALRGWHLSIPLRYDEAVTLLDYATGGFSHAATSYATPNNHVLHSLLVHAVTSVAGATPALVRLPAFVAGCLLVPATAWLAALRHGPRVGVLAAFMVAGTPVLVEYSANARGYALVALATVAAIAVGERLLRRPTTGGWVALGLLGVAGLYTVPVMLLPWAGITVWLWTNLFLGGGGLRERLRRELPLVTTEVAVAMAVVLLYLPVVRSNGLDALTANRFVETLGWSAFAGTLPAAARAVAVHWLKAVPGALVFLLAIGVLAAVLLRSGHDRRTLAHGAGERFPLGLALVLGVVAVMLVKRNPGEARIWLWALPPVLTAGAAGLVALLERAARPALARGLAAGVGAAWFALTSAHLVTDRALWGSLETGAFMQVEEVAAWLTERADPADAVVTDFVSWEPLRYYLGRQGLAPDELDDPPAPDGRAWVVVNHVEPDRPRRAVMRAASLGIRLEGARPMATFGPVEIYGFGSPDAGAAGAGEGLPEEAADAGGTG